MILKMVITKMMNIKINDYFLQLLRLNSYGSLSLKVDQFDTFEPSTFILLKDHTPVHSSLVGPYLV